MKYKYFAVLICLVLLAHGFGSAGEGDKILKEFYVSVSGDDAAGGSAVAPFATIERAQQAVRTQSGFLSGENKHGDVVVHIGGGIYFQDETLNFKNPDGGKGVNKVIWQGDKENPPVISGGVALEGFQQTGDGLWAVKAENLDFARELFVNGVRADRANSGRKIAGLKNYIAPDSPYGSDGFYANEADIGLFDNPEDMDLHFSVGWKGAIMKVRDIVPAGEPGQVIVKMTQPQWASQWAINASYHAARFDFGFIAENAMEYLDTPGEFYFNRRIKTLYYYPREGEKIENTLAVVPRLDKLIDIRGESIGNKVRNLVFSDIVFAHTSWNALNRYGFTHGQQQVNYVNGERMFTPGAFEISRAEGIEITACVFQGMTTAAIELYDGAGNNRIVGNIFADLGDSAVVVGRPGDAYIDPVPKGAANVASRKRIETSYASAVDAINFATVDNPYDTSSVPWVWYSNPRAAKFGIRDWVKVDLEEAFSIDRVKLGFRDDIPPSHKQNLEILVSNDPNFETYTTLAGNPSIKGTTFTAYSHGLADKFRYVLIRKTKPERMAISAVWVFSNEVPWTAMEEVCKNNQIENNIMERVSISQYGNPAVSAYYVEKLRVAHNEIYDTPYSGICLGWGWGNTIDSVSCRENEVIGNLIDGYNRYCTDGGGIYTLGNQPGTKIAGNLVKNEGNAFGGAVYLDEGSAYIEVSGNVMENVSSWLQLWSPSSYDNKIGQNFATTPVYRNTANRTYFTDAVKYVWGTPTVEAQRIINQAGLEDGWKFIKTRRPAGKAIYLQGRDMHRAVYDLSANPAAHNTNGDASNWFRAEMGEKIAKKAEYFLENADFGVSAGQYSLSSKLALQTAFDNYNAQDRADHQSFGVLDKTIAVNEALLAAKKSISHPSLAEMKGMFEDLSDNLREDGSLGSYAPGTKKLISDALARAQAAICKDKADEYGLVLQLEKVWQEAQQRKISDEIAFVSITDAEVSIDKEKKLVRASFEHTDSRTGKFLQAVADGSAKIAFPFNKSMELWQNTIIPVYTPETGKYTYWTLTPSAVSKEGWAASNKNSPPIETENGVALAAWEQPQMYLGKTFGPSCRLALKPVRADASDGVSVLFSAQSAEKLVPTGYQTKNTFYRLCFTARGMAVYEAVSGKETLLNKVEKSLVWGDWNEVSIELADENRVLVTLAGALVLDCLSSGAVPRMGYLGVLSPNTGLEVVLR